MRVLVTGSAGFIGYQLCRKLLMGGHEVIGIDKHAPDYDIELLKERRTRELSAFDNFQFIKLDILNEGFKSILSGQTVDFVVHLAARDFYYDDPHNIEYSPFLENNVVGSAKVFELAKLLEAKKFIFGSTHSVYGKTKKGILTEKKLLPQPISPHGASKIAAEQVLHFMSHFYNLPVVIFRMFSVYGPEMRPHTLIPLLVDRISKGLPVDLYHDADATRDFIYIDDVVNYILAVLNKRLKFQVINIASGKAYTMQEVAEIVAKILGKDPAKVGIVSHEKDFRHLVQKHTVADISRARKILKYTPQVSLEEGLKKTIDWYLANPDILDRSTHHAS